MSVIGKKNFETVVLPFYSSVKPLLLHTNSSVKALLLHMNSSVKALLLHTNSSVKSLLLHSLLQRKVFNPLRKVALQTTLPTHKLYSYLPMKSNMIYLYVCPVPNITISISRPNGPIASLI